MTTRPLPAMIILISTIEEACDIKDIKHRKRATRKKCKQAGVPVEDVIVRCLSTY